MPRLSIKALMALGLVTALVSLTGCPEDEVCTADSDCAGGLVCNDDGKCVDDGESPFELQCSTDSDCDSRLECLGGGCICDAGLCEEGCRRGSDCADGQACDRETNSCVEIPDQCENDGDCPDGTKCDTAADPAACVPECAVSADCSSGLVCDAGECVGCSDDEQCDGELGYSCIDARCQIASLQCDLVGEVCDPVLSVNAGFSCAKFANDDTYKCYESCELEEACTPALVDTAGDGVTVDDERGFMYYSAQTCSTGSICEADGDGTRACRRSECEDPVRGQADCDALAAANPAIYPNGANCVERTKDTTVTIPRGANFAGGFTDEGFFCQPAGQLQEDEQGCSAPAGLTGAAPRCAEGLLCVNDMGLFDLRQVDGVCKRPCTNDAQCNPGESCLGEDDDSEFETVGICGVRCEPFTVDTAACPADTKCLAVSNEDGICSDLIGGSGPSEVYGPCENDQSCPSGTICLNVGEGRCMPQCDPTLRNQEAQNESCFGGNPQAFVKFAHLAQNAGAVDVYVDGELVVDDLEFNNLGDDNGTWLELEPGVHAVSVVDGARTDGAQAIVSLEIDAAKNTSTIYSVIPAEGATPVQVIGFGDDRVTLAANDTNAVLRFAHAVVGVSDVDIVAVAADADVSDAANQNDLVLGLTYGAASPYATVAVGTYDVYVFAAGEAARTDLSALTVFEDIDVTANTVGTVMAFGLTTGANPQAPGVFIAPHERFQDQPDIKGFCYDLNQGSAITRPGTGICLQQCDGYQAYGAGECGARSNPVDACQEFGDDVSVCFVQGTAAVGEVCDGNNDCADGSFCDFKGDNTGICRSYCTLDGYEPNPHVAGCSGDEACMPSADIEGLGKCLIPCTPDAPGTFIDSDCPEGQKTCRFNEGNYHCQASGDIAVNDQCGGGGESPSSNPGCAAGSLCTRDILVPDSAFQRVIDSFLTSLDRETNVCRQVCRPFLPPGQSDCPADYACNPLLPTQELQTVNGVCLPKISDEDLAAVRTEDRPDACPADRTGDLCGNGAFCGSNGSIPDTDSMTCSTTASCTYLCDPATLTGCPADMVCETLGSVDNPGLFIGAFGICRDE